MDVASVQGNVHAAAAVTPNQDQASALVQKVVRNPSASDGDVRAAKAAANDGDRDDAGPTSRAGGCYRERNQGRYQRLASMISKGGFPLPE